MLNPEQTHCHMDDLKEGFVGYLDTQKFLIGYMLNVYATTIS